MCYLLEAIYNVYKNAAYILFDTAIQSLTRCSRKDFTQGCKDIRSTMSQMSVCPPKEDALPSTVTARGWRAFGRPSLDEVSMVGSHDGTSIFLRRGRETWAVPFSLSLCHRGIRREGGPLQQIPERAFNRIAPAGTLILDFTASLTVINIFLLFRPPSLRCFIMATRAD